MSALPLAPAEAVTNPEVLTETAALLLDHIPPAVASDSCSVLPEHTSKVVAEVIGATVGSGLTVIVAVIGVTGHPFAAVAVIWKVVVTGEPVKFVKAPGID